MSRQCQGRQRRSKITTESLQRYGKVNKEFEESLEILGNRGKGSRAAFLGVLRLRI